MPLEMKRNINTMSVTVSLRSASMAEGSLKDDTEVSGMDAELLEAERQNGRNRQCQITRYTRDLRGQVTETVDALGQKETYTYDKKGQLLGKLDKEGYLTKYAYTKQGDLSGIQYADGKGSETVL